MKYLKSKYNVVLPNGFALLFLGFSFLWFLLLILGPNIFIGFASILLFVWFGYFLWKKDNISFLLIFFLYISYFAAIVSSGYLETGAYISEQYRSSYATGATLRLVGYVMLMLSVTYLVIINNKASFNVLYKIKQNRYVLSDYFIFGITLIIVGILVVSIFKFGLPITKGVQRFDYWVSHPYPIIKTFLTQLTQLSFILGAMHAHSNKIRKRRIILLSFLFFILLNVLYGDKFSSNFLCIVNYAISYFVINLFMNGKKVNVSRIMLLGSGAIIVFYFMIFWSYTNLHHIEESQVNKYIFDRAFSLQGHTWWGVDNLVLNDKNNVPSSELIRKHEMENPGGLYILMYAISPAESVDVYLDKGVTYTMGGIAIAIYTLGYYGAIGYVILAGIMIGLVLLYIYKKIILQQYIRAWFGIKLSWLMTLAFAMGNVYLLVGLSAFIYLMSILFDIFIFNEKNIILENRRERKLLYERTPI